MGVLCSGQSMVGQSHKGNFFIETPGVCFYYKKVLDEWVFLGKSILFEKKIDDWVPHFIAAPSLKNLVETKIKLELALIKNRA